MTEEEIKKAYTEGKTIQYNLGTKENPDWADWETPKFDDEPIDYHYRVKPEAEKLAEEYAKKNPIKIYGWYGNVEKRTDEVEDAFLAGYKAGQPKWHKVADGDLPKDRTDVLTYSVSQGYQVKHFYLNVKIFGDLAVSEVIAWCEIP